MSEPRPPARILSDEEVPKPPPTRPRAAAILVRTIGDLRATEPEEGTPVRGAAIIHVIGGANGDDDRAVARSSGVLVIGGANGADEDGTAARSVIHVIGGANGGDEGDAITATGGIRIIGSRDDGEVR